ncbi:hypothetical protein AB4K20DRAFT_1975585 [Rhizopus microsporus]|uniref:Uncharacterized protein n=1 Tax=Rhizopus microsporus TaxID=58291 RepID=A0A1X0RSX8_RHIZD|nr:hypothetical protein BCV71DRAFT_237772 [Rhizopus microsporus]
MRCILLSCIFFFRAIGSCRLLIAHFQMSCSRRIAAKTMMDRKRSGEISDIKILYDQYEFGAAEVNKTETNDIKELNGTKVNFFQLSNSTGHVCVLKKKKELHLPVYSKEFINRIVLLVNQV